MDNNCEYRCSFCCKAIMEASQNTVKDEKKGINLPEEECVKKIPVTFFQMTAIKHVLDERKRQDEQWGEQDNELTFWMSILGEEFGEACQAVNNYKLNLTENTSAIQEELVQVAAVAIAILENIKRNINPPCPLIYNDILLTSALYRIGRAESKKEEEKDEQGGAE